MRPPATQMLIPAHPVLSWAALARRQAPYAGSMLTARRVWLLTSGRVALAHALRAWGVATGDEILLPSYHCLAMVTPVEWLGARPVYYPLRQDFTPDEAALASLVSPRTRAVVVVHYFGFETPLPALRSFSDRHGLALIEDCAHAFYSHGANGPLGGSGDYAIASPMKFLPIFDGGVLVARAQAPAPQISFDASPWSYELKATVDVLERAAYLRRLPGLNGLIRAVSFLKRALPRPRTIAVPAAIAGQFEFDPRWLERQPSRVSQLLIALAERERIARLRRAVYGELVARLAGAPGVELPFARLEKGTVPYVLPVYCDAGEEQFRRAREAGIQVLRWEFTERQACPLAQRAARGLLQLPCHQSLEPADVDLIVNVLHGRAR